MKRYFSLQESQNLQHVDSWQEDTVQKINKLLPVAWQAEQ